ncbi:carbohydrate binding family 9 domain-containing protein [Spirosoma validum]|uniref:Carbohydrate binding family 9 domain-containing protein n=1 Tax=Spirosoma validum TaxID=2771355 RepID=A0A927B7C2_9BACT|nr:carbohydrate binding family 9 domain-containing protein [Spirosoma validum]MBD2756542.1 carbohydrate binding family 9 domain-containing protein [Spirosoma validum]
MKYYLIPLWLLLTVDGWAQEKTPYIMPRFEGPFRLDGILDEPGWKTIPSFPVTMHIPTVGAEPTERTEFRVAYDDNFLYVAGWLYDSHSKGIQELTFKRDDFGSADWFGIALDTFADKENALAFYTTPSGNRIDATNKNDAQGDDWLNLSWNTFWYCATSRNDNGWFAEFKIPLSSLRYQDKNGRVTMGMHLNRRIARKNEYITYPLISNQWGFTSQFKASQMQPIVFEHLRPRTPVYITPYVLGGLSSVPQLNADQTAYQLQHTATWNAGLDMKIGITSNLTADLTINTDFAQVEADDQQVNLTRFNLFFPEKRLFFQERASIFTFSFGGVNQLFYSRQIGLNSGQRVPILAGGRMVGRIGRWDVGILDMQTKATGSLSSENMSVVRLRRRVFNQNSYIGLMTTARLGTDGHANVTYGVDGIFRVYDQNFLSVNWAQTFDRLTTEQTQRNGRMPTRRFFDPARWQVRYEKRILKGFGYDLSLSQAGRNYNPGLGFESRKDYMRFGDRLFWGWLPGKNSVLLNHQVSLYGYAFLRNSNGTAESVEVSPGWDALFKKGHRAQVKVRNSYESVVDTLTLFGIARIPGGQYRFQSLYGLLATPGNKPLNATLETEIGRFYDGSRVSLSVRPTWAISRYLELSSYLQWNRIRFPNRAQQYDVTLAQIRMKVSLNVNVSTEALIQYNSVAKLVSSNIRFRYNPREGNDLYIVFNQGTSLETNPFDSVGRPTQPALTDRSMIVKYTYTFVK